jgi:hypothetical protein
MAQMKISDQKLFKHDCDQCTFLGHFVNSDVYTCSKGNVLVRDIRTFIARYGNEGPEYTSMPVLSIEELSVKAVSHGGPVIRAILYGYFAWEYEHKRG